MRPTWFVAGSVNQRLPSALKVMLVGVAFTAGVPVGGTANSVRVPPVVSRPILPEPDSANQSVLNGPAVMPWGWLPAANEKLVTTPAVVTRLTALVPGSVTHNAPSGPVTRSAGLLPVIRGNSLVTTPAVVMRPTWSVAASVNHSAPSGPAAIPRGPVLTVRPNSLTTPAVVTRAIWSMPNSLTHKAPSPPRAIPCGSASLSGKVNSLMAPAGVTSPTLAVVASVNQTAPVAGTEVIATTPLAPKRRSNSLTVLGAAGVMLATRLALGSVNQRLPSGPAVIPRGAPFGVMPVLSSVTVPWVAPVAMIRPTRLPLGSVNQMLLSGPSARPVARCRR